MNPAAGGNPSPANSKGVAPWSPSRRWTAERTSSPPPQRPTGGGADRRSAFEDRLKRDLTPVSAILHLMHPKPQATRNYHRELWFAKKFGKKSWS